MPDKRPNIIVIFPDQHRGCDLGVAGNKQVKTPNIDKLAADGLYLPNTFSGCPVTCPARSVLQSGKYPHKSGLRINDLRMPPDQKTLGTELSAAGYKTAFVGKWHLDGGIREPGFIPQERRMGWQWWAANQCRHNYFNTWYFRDTPEEIKMTEYETIEWTDLAIEFMREQVGQDDPFCLLLGYGPPHDPYIAPDEYMDMYPEEDIELRPNFVEGTILGGGRKHELTKKDYKGYYASITCIDDNVGRIMATLDEMGITGDTLVVFTSDHGDMLGSHNMVLKRKPHEESIQVPGIFHYPARIKPGQTKNAIFSWVDIMPTLLSAAGVAIPEDVQGADLTNVLYDPEADGPESAYLQIYMPYPTKVDGGWRGVHTKRYTYARYEDRPWVLFDNREDRYQFNNLANDPAHEFVRKELDALIEDWMEKTEDSWSYNVPKFIPLHTHPVEEHEGLVADLYEEARKEPPKN